MAIFEIKGQGNQQNNSQAVQTGANNSKNSVLTEAEQNLANLDARYESIELQIGKKYVSLHIKFCNFCGASLEDVNMEEILGGAFCTSCGSIVTKGSRFCTVCGAPINNGN